MNIDQFIAHIRQSCQQKVFFHFTDARNLPSIRVAGGIFPMQTLRKKGIGIPAPGGNDWSFEADARVGMDRYVHLCFMNNHSMQYAASNDGRIQSTVWLRIDPDVLKLPGVMITTDVSNQAGVTPMPVAQAIAALDLEVLYSRMVWRDPPINARLKAAQRYEVLVPDIVPAALIANLNG